VNEKGNDMKPCLPPLATTPRPSWRAPALSCDCHFHIFGPYDRFPLDAGRHYDPQAATIADYQRMADALGIERMVRCGGTIRPGSRARCGGD